MLIDISQNEIVIAIIIRCSEQHYRAVFLFSPLSESRAPYHAVKTRQ
jgi:hypothetical protein